MVLKDDLDEVLTELWECFSQDASDIFKTLEDSLLELENEPSARPAIDRAYRAVHTLKGNARVLELYRMEALVHHAEDLLGLVRDYDVAVDSGILDCFFELLDGLRGWLPGVVASRGDLEAPWTAALESRFEGMVAAKRRGVVAPRVLPEASAADPAPDPAPEPDSDPALLRIFVEMVLGDWARLHNTIAALDSHDPSSMEGVRATLDDWAFAAGRVGQGEIQECLGRCLEGLKGGDSEQLDAALLVVLELVDEVGRGPGVFPELPSDEETAFAPDAEYVRIFLELAEEEMEYLAAGIQHPQLGAQRLMLRQTVGRLLHAATQMGYGQLVGMLNTLGERLDTAKVLEREPLVLAERALFSALMTVQQQAEELAGLEPATLAAITTRYRLWHVRRVEQSVARLQEIVVGLSNETLRGSQAWAQEAVQICGSLREVLLHFGEEGAAAVVMGMMDVLERGAQQEISLRPDLVALLRSLGGTVSAVSGASLADPAELGAFSAHAGAVLDGYARGSAVAGETLYGQLPLGDEYRAASTPEIQSRLQDALAAGEEFYQLRVDLERDHATAGRFVQWLESTGVRNITNITVQQGERSLFEFLVSTTLSPDVVRTQIEALDPPMRTVCLFRGPHRVGLALEEARTSNSSLPAALQPPLAAEQTPSLPNASGSPLELLKVESRKVDYLIDLSAEIGVVTEGMRLGPTRETLDPVALLRSLQRLESLSAELKMVTATLRLVPISGAFDRLRRVLRDLSKSTGKAMDLELLGGDIELDKVVVEGLHEPLMHVLRNAADHGVESPQERRAAGKPERAKITVGASQEGTEVRVVVRDDGRGLNRDAILARAQELGLVEPGDDPGDEGVFNCIFHPGFSTAEEVSSLSGRGVGLDIVRERLVKLRGHLAVQSEPGAGTTVTFRVPLSLASLDGMVVGVDGRTYILALEDIATVVKVPAAELDRISASSERTMLVEGEPVPLCPLAELYEEEPSGSPEGEHRMVLVMDTAFGRVALPVDEVLGQQQVTLKPLTGHLSAIRAGAGCAVLPSGDVAIALHADLLHRARH